jgi:hypothetical protein
MNLVMLECDLRTHSKPDVVEHSYNLNSQEAEAGGLLSLRPAWTK